MLTGFAPDDKPDLAAAAAPSVIGGKDLARSNIQRLTPNGRFLGRKFFLTEHCGPDGSSCGTLVQDQLASPSRFSISAGTVMIVFSLRGFAEDSSLEGTGFELAVPPLCSAIDPIERLVEHGFMPGAVPGLDIGLYLAKKVGMRPLLGGEALGTERAHLSVETLYVDCAGLMILNDDLPPDESVDVRAHSAFDKGVDDVKFRVDPGISRDPIEIDKDRIALHAGHQRTDLVRTSNFLDDRRCVSMDL